MRRVRDCLLIIIFLSVASSLAQCKGEESRRLPEPGPVPGVAIDYLDSKDKDYVGSPGIAIVSKGHYVASHDTFGDGPKGGKGRLTTVFESADFGRTWKRLTELDGQWWSSLFVHKGQLYIIGVSRKHGNIVIRRSTDGGKTWTEPVDENTGLLVEGRFHCAPVPVTEHNGRLWRGFEVDSGGYRWEAFVMSTPVDSDLLKADSWVASSKVMITKAVGRKWLEGNVVVTPEGGLVNILRSQPKLDKAAVIEVSPDGRFLTLNPEDCLIDFPGANKKFTIRHDEMTGKYWSLVNIVTDPGPLEEPPQDHRNTLALTCSKDLRKWEVRYVALSFMNGEHLTRQNNKFGFQYIDWLIEGDDIIFVSRTAWGWDTPRSHDANYLTFHRIRNFRDKTVKDKPLCAGP
ncbi:MAG: sialidase family protein [Planctomycetota bacterium]|jgi:hypothetical protein